MPNLHNIRAAVTSQLQAAGIGDAATEAAYVLALALQCDRAALLVDRELQSAEIEFIQTLATRRAAREPLDRLRGSREFYGLNFGLNSATLSPRADTEALVELVLEHASNATSILDIGTGTGCVLLALLHNIPQARGVGIDIAPLALEQAQANAQALEIDATFMNSSWYKNVDGVFDVIVSNPPYIPSAEIEMLEPEVKNHDSRAALDGGADGLEPYRILFAGARAHLKPQGMVMMEIGAGQGDDVKAIALQHGFNLIGEKYDLAGILRALAFH